MAKKPYTTYDNSRHKAIIASLAAFPEVKTVGFWKALRALPDAEYFTTLLAEDDDWVRQHRFVPDAYAIDADSSTVTIFEAVVTHDIPPAKIAKIVNMGWALDQSEWELVLIRCDVTSRQVYIPTAMHLMEIFSPGFDQKTSTDDGLFKAWRSYTADNFNASIVNPKPHHARG